MKPGGGRLKGVSFERQMVKRFNEWWPAGDFRRSPKSGGWEKNRNVQEVVAAGDLYTPRRMFPFSIECKKQEGSWDLGRLLVDSTKGPIEGWWQQCVRDAELMDKEPMLVFTRNNYPTFVMLRVGWWGHVLRYGAMEDIMEEMKLNILSVLILKERKGSEVETELVCVYSLEGWMRAFSAPKEAWGTVEGQQVDGKTI